MQKLGERRLTNTPQGIPQALCNCGLSLNSSEGRDSATGLKTSPNSPDAALTARGHAGQNLRVSVVYVLNKRGKPLMPCSPRKTRVLLEESKARVVKRTPFTIQLTIAGGETKQPITLGVDSGYSRIGLSAVTHKQELYSAQVFLRTEMVKLNSERRQYRRFRRYRKTWYRKPRFLNRKKPQGWLAPSIQNKFDTHVKLIHKVKEILPVSQINIEVAAFDIQKIKDPEISGSEYQRGAQRGFWNIREYVLYRDWHLCQHCQGKSRDPVLEVHHIISRQIGTDRPDNLVTLCSTCHKRVSKGELKLNIDPSKEFKAETFMSTVRWMLINKLKGLGNVVFHTYGYITKQKRAELKFPKSHTNDAFLIAGATTQNRVSVEYLIQQARKCNRKLFKGERSHIKNTAERLICGFQRFDKVMWKGVECFIFGRRKTGYFDIRKLDATKIHASAKAKELSLLERAKTLLIERRTVLLPSFTEGVSEPSF
ncbi:hypothetical protein ES707_00590 [subsurface metagenome]